MQKPSSSSMDGGILHWRKWAERGANLVAPRACFISGCRSKKQHPCLFIFSSKKALTFKNSWYIFIGTATPRNTLLITRPAQPHRLSFPIKPEQRLRQYHITTIIFLVVSEKRRVIYIEEGHKQTLSFVRQGPGVYNGGTTSIENERRFLTPLVCAGCLLTGWESLC